MTLQEINLLAFGPFTQRTLDFSTKNALHVVYGPNEAGKSSSLRGLKALLYGMNPRTKDNYIHDNRSLRIAGTLCNKNAQTLTFIRRKGNKDTLLDVDGTPLNESVLTPFLHGVSSELFDMLFGIDYQSLLHGGEEILKQKGEVGQALFSASTGSASLHRVLQQLEKEAEELFKPNGSTPAVNVAIKSYTQLKKAMAEKSLSSRDWDAARKAFEQTDAELQRTQIELDALKNQQRRLLRIERSLPALGERGNCLAEIRKMGDVIIVAEDFDKRRQQAVSALDSALEAADAAELRKQSLQEKAHGITVNGQLLEQKSVIEDLHTRWGAFKKAIGERPQLQLEKGRRQAKAELLLKSIRPDVEITDAYTLQPVLSRTAQIAELASQRQGLIDRGDRFKRQANELDKEHNTAVKAVAQLPPSPGQLDSLTAQLRTSQRAGNIDEQIGDLQKQIAALTTECEATLVTLHTVWHGSLDTLMSTPWPSKESIARFDQAFREQDTIVARYREQRDTCVEKLRDAQLHLQEIKHAGDIPTESDLARARDDRDFVWDLVFRRWVKDEDISSDALALETDSPLTDVFETRKAQADDLSDRLRRETGRVQKQAQLLALIEDGELQLSTLETRLRDVSTAGVQLENQWQSLWQPATVTPLPTAEMRVWLESVILLKSRIADLTQYQQQAANLEETRKAHITSILDELQRLGEDIAPTKSLEKTLTEGELAASRLIQSESDRNTFTRRISELGDEIATANTNVDATASDLQAWKAQWKLALQELGLDADATPSKVEDTLDDVRTLFSELDEVGRLRDRLDAIDTEEHAYLGDLDALIRHVMPELRGQSVDQSVAQLMAALTDAGQQGANRHQIEIQITEALDDITQANATTKTMTSRIAALCTEANCRERGELEEAVQRSREYLKLKASVEKCELELLAMGKGIGLDTLEEDAAAIDPDNLQSDLESLRNQIENDKEPRITELATEKGAKNSELALMNGSNDSALLAEEAQSQLEIVRTNAEQYVQLKVAAKILRDQIECYRRENQGPMLKHASKHFARLTLGSFVELQADLDERDNPVLAGVRPDGTHVYVDGMSSGTRDQLYLALRLASLEKYIDSVEPMPFIVDDILVHFDDQRSAATLEILSELAKRTQIILFTHHERLVEQAMTIPGDNVCIHRL